MISESERAILKELVVVYVEDDEIIRELLAMSISRRFKNFYVVEHGLLGLDAVIKYKPDIILTDIEMPFLDGIAMAKRLREEFEVTMPIIALTAYNDEEHKSKYFSDYVYKPINLDKLYSAILTFAHIK